MRWLPLTLVLLGSISVSRTQAQVPQTGTQPPAPGKVQSDVPQVPPGEPPPDAAIAAPPVVAPSDGSEELVLPAEASGDIELTEQELRELGFDPTEASSGAALDLAFHVGGFADFGIARLFVPDDSIWHKIEGPWQKSFAVGNFNLYLSKNINESFRTMGEVRFLYLPNGTISEEPGTISRYNGMAADYNDFNRPLSWGGVEIERVYIEWALHSNLSLRIGQFLTPYGIWNVDHGSPTVIPIERPFVIGMEVFPERQTGLELFGRFELSASTTLGYHATLSNGAGPASEWLDPDGDKAVGGRVYWENRAFGEFRLGASAYYGMNTDAISYSYIGPDGLLFDQQINSQFQQMALAADVQWKFHGLHMQAEVLSQQRNYTEEGRTLQPNNANGQPSYFADWHSYGGYFLVGYRLPWLGIMPYALVMTGTFNIQALKMSPINGTFGINIRPWDSVVFKVEYIHTHPFENEYFKDELRRLGAQVAWAF